VRVIPTPAEDAGLQAFERAVEAKTSQDGRFRNKVNAMSKACEQVRSTRALGTLRSYLRQLSKTQTTLPFNLPFPFPRL
jgi:hypothetical protein